MKMFNDHLREIHIYIYICCDINALTLIIIRILMKYIILNSYNEIEYIIVGSYHHHYKV